MLAYLNIAEQIAYLQRDAAEAYRVARQHYNAGRFAAAAYWQARACLYFNAIQLLREAA